MSHSPASFQPLESRRLLAADLIASITSYSLPANVTAGNAIHGSATVLLTNKGSAINKKSPKIEVNLLIRPGLTAGQPSTPIGSKNFIPVAGLAKNHSTSVTIPITIPASNKAGSFSLVAIADATHKVPESNENNNQAVSKTKYTIKAPLADLKLSAATTTLKKSGVPGTASVTLLNSGPVPLTGSVNIIFTAVPSLSSFPTLSLGRKNSVPINLKRNQTLKVSNIPLAPLTPPTTTSAAILYSIVASITPHTTPADTNTTDNKLTAATLSVLGSLPVDPNPLIANGLSPVLTFAVGTTTTDPILQFSTTTGTVTDAAGHTGTYSYQSPPIFGSIAQLNLTFPAQTGITPYNQTFNLTGSTLFTTIPNPSGTIDTFSITSATNADQLSPSGSNTTFYLIPS